MRVALYGSAGAARTLLVFNGIGASLETVAPFATQFRDTRVVTFDVPGVGAPPLMSCRYMTVLSVVSLGSESANPTTLKSLPGWFVTSRVLRTRQVPSGPLRLFDRLVPVLRALDELRLPFGLSLWTVARRPG